MADHSLLAGVGDSRCDGWGPGLAGNEEHPKPMTNRLELSVVERTPFADGESFASTGPYERIAGRVHFSVDPTLQAQAGVVDIDKAARDAHGRVHFTADFMLLKP